jgi:hypothetical protein
MKKVKVSNFGRDHWSLLAYMESLCVDSLKNGVGEIDKRRMRANEKRHPLHAVNIKHGIGPWQKCFGTRVAGYWDSMGKPVKKRQVAGHDDWDCLNDLEAADFLEVLSEANGFVVMSEKGMKVAAELRAYKAKGGMFSGFRWREPEAVKALGKAAIA